MLVPRGSLTAVLLGDPLGGEGAQGAAGLCVGCQWATDLSLVVIIAAIQVAGLVEGLGIQKAVARLEETLQLGELLAGTFILQRRHCCVVTGLSQSHVLGFITTRRERPTSNCPNCFTLLFIIILLFARATFISVCKYSTYWYAPTVNWFPMEGTIKYGKWAWVDLCQPFEWIN